jgi:membrane associated rhomboid family serine protease
VIAGHTPNPSPLPAWMTLVTSMFLHNGWLHIGGNMLFLFVFGDDIEETMGWWRFLIFYSRAASSRPWPMSSPTSTATAR